MGAKEKNNRQMTYEIIFSPGLKNWILPILQHEYRTRATRVQHNCEASDTSALSVSNKKSLVLWMEGFTFLIWLYIKVWDI